MKEIKFTPQAGSVLNLGQQYDNNARQIEFKGYRCDPNNLASFKFERPDGFKKIIALADNKIIIGKPLTDVAGRFKGQLIETDSDKNLISQSDEFICIIKPSIDADEEYEAQDPTLNLWTEKVKGLYDEVSEKLENGEFKGEKGDKGDDATLSDEQMQNIANEVKDSLDVDDIAEKVKGDINLSGYELKGTAYTKTESDEKYQKIGDYIVSDDLKVYAKKNEIPTKLSELEEDVVLGVKDYNDLENKPEIPSLEGYAKKEDIPSVPTKVSELTNDSGYLTEHQSLEGLATEDDLEATENRLSESIINISDRVEILENATPSGGGGMSVASANLLCNILTESLYGSDQVANIAKLKELLLSNSTEPDEPDEPQPVASKNLFDYNTMIVDGKFVHSNGTIVTRSDGRMLLIPNIEHGVEYSGLSVNNSLGSYSFNIAEGKVDENGVFTLLKYKTSAYIFRSELTYTAKISLEDENSNAIALSYSIVSGNETAPYEKAMLYNYTEHGKLLPEDFEPYS